MQDFCETTTLTKRDCAKRSFYKPENDHVII